MIKTRNRRGDNAEMALIMLVGDAVVAKSEPAPEVKEKPAATTAAPKTKKRAAAAG